MTLSRRSCRNILLQLMEENDFARLAPRFERVELEQDDVIAEAGGAIDTICFPETGVASYAEVATDGTTTGIGMVGYEGMVEWSALLGGTASPYQMTIAVGPATAHRIAADDLIMASRASPPLHDLLMRFIRSFIAQLSRTVVSNLCDPVERRMCRWLLMNHDRLKTDEIELTHRQIGEMLGVRRASVTDALHILEGEKIIRAERRRIVVLDRDLLRRCAGESYGAAEAAYSRLLARFGKDGETATG
jgi:CRP-like cAMP-binding protein